MGQPDSPHTDDPEQATEHEGTRNDGTNINRRTTLQLLAVMGGVGAFASTGGAETDTAPQSADATEQAEQEPAPDEPTRPPYIEANFGDQLSDDDLNHVPGDIASDLRNAKALDAVELDYTVDPAFTFRAYRGDDC